MHDHEHRHLHHSTVPEVQNNMTHESDMFGCGNDWQDHAGCRPLWVANNTIGDFKDIGASRGLLRAYDAQSCGSSDTALIVLRESNQNATQDLVGRQLPYRS